MNELAEYEKRSREAAPDVSIESLRFNRDGLVNDVVVVNEELIFRFAKSVNGIERLRVETRILRLLQKHISLLIPEPIYLAEGMMGYYMISGETLRRDMLMRLGEGDQQAIADQLAQFFSELHGVPTSEITEFDLPAADALMSYDGWVNAYERIREKVFPLLMPHVRDWAESHFETHLADRGNFEYELKLVDTDIPPYHILFDSGRKRINGIIDFGCAGLGDPAIDLGIIIYNYGESFLKRFYHVYPAAESYLRRARFYGGAHELRWMLMGVEKNDNWWFGVHAGSAKDVGYES